MAAALNHHGIKTRSRTGDVVWTGAEVDERTKQHEVRAFPRGAKDVASARETLVANWGMRYYPIKGAVREYEPPKRSRSGDSQPTRKPSPDF